MNLARAIVDQDEIVSRAVHFGETQHSLSSSIVCGESQGAAKDRPSSSTCRCQMAFWRLSIPP
jgi:hypothetical protein